MITAFFILVILAADTAWGDEFVHELEMVDSGIKDGRVETVVRMKGLRKYENLIMYIWQYKTHQEESEVTLGGWSGLEMGPIDGVWRSRGFKNNGDAVNDGNQTHSGPFPAGIKLSGEVTHVRMMIISMVSCSKLEDDPHPDTITVYSKWFPVAEIRAIQKEVQQEPLDGQP